MLKLFCIAGALLGFIGVAAGSFGAHGLKALLEANGQAANWETGVRYCLFHAVAVLAICGLATSNNSSVALGLLTAAAGCFVVGVLIFSGFLSILALTGLRWLGAIVPIGGVLLLVGWGFLTAALWRLRF